MWFFFDEFKVIFLIVSFITSTETLLGFDDAALTPFKFEVLFPEDEVAVVVEEDGNDVEEATAAFEFDDANRVPVNVDTPFFLDVKCFDL